MGERSKIEWTDHTFNPWIGCTKVSPGCANCYAERDWDKRRHVAEWGPQGTRVVTSEDNWKKPLRWNKQAAESGTRIKVFCASLSDVFEDWDGSILSHDGGRLFINPDAAWMLTDADASRTPFGSRFATMDDVRKRLFVLIDSTPNLDWILVTKRPENIIRMWPRHIDSGDDPAAWSVELGDATGRGSLPRYVRNVWLLTSVENQEQADKRIPELLKCRDLSPVLGISVEPLLGPINLRLGSWECDNCHNLNPVLTGSVCAFCMHQNEWEQIRTRQLDWVIVGGESGPNARPMHPDWARSLRDQCAAAGVPFFFKQWGEYLPYSEVRSKEQQQAYSKATIAGKSNYFGACIVPGPSGWMTGTTPGIAPFGYAQIGKRLAGRVLDGVEHNAFPQLPLRVSGGSP